MAAEVADSDRFDRVVDAPSRGVVDDLRLGDRVVGVVGRLRGAKAEVVAIESFPSPSGDTIRLVRVRRPRAGESYEFPHALRRIDDVPAAEG